MRSYLSTGLVFYQIATALVRADADSSSSGNVTAGAIATNSTQVLLPAAHPDVDTSDPALLKPTKSTLLFFAQDSESTITDDGNSTISSDGNSTNTSIPDTRRMFRRSDSEESNVATLFVDKAAYSSVNLLHTDSIQGLTCAPDSVKVTFKTEEAYSTVSSVWPGLKTFVLITYEDGCGPGFPKGEHSYLLVRDCQPSKSTFSVQCSAQYIGFTDFIGDENLITVDMGLSSPKRRVRSRKRSVGDTLSRTAEVAHFDLAKRLSGSKSKTFSFNAFPSNSNTKWGKAYSLYNKNNLQVYCVACGVSGSITLTGKISFTIKHGFTDGSLRANGNIHSGLELGVIAQAKALSIPIADKILVTVPLSGFSIPEILTVGPILTLGAGGSLDVGVQGSLLAGVVLDWPVFDVTADLVHRHSSSAKGLVPNLSPVFDAQGSASVTANAHLSLRLGVGVDVLKGKWDKTVAVVEQPGVSVKGGVGGAVAGCAKEGVGVSLNNKVFLDFVGLEQISLWNWNSAQLKKCF